jgi:hypothetical protein
MSFDPEMELVNILSVNASWTCFVIQVQYSLSGVGFKSWGLLRPQVNPFESEKICRRVRAFVYRDRRLVLLRQD